MTKNQIEFLKYQETQRANREQEALTRTRDYNNYILGSGTLAETQRANRESERLRSIDLQQQRVRNEQTYAVALGTLEETRRSNLVREDIQERSLAENIRSNYVNQGHTSVSLYLQEQANQERQRSNLVSEQHQRDVLSETKRLNSARIALDQASLDEQIRTHKANESIGRTQASASMIQAAASTRNAETNWYSAQNQAQYQRSQVELGLTSNQIRQAEQREAMRANQAREQELKRHNIVSEQQTATYNKKSLFLQERKLEDYYALQQQGYSVQKRGQNLQALTQAGRYLVPIITGGLF